MARAFRGDTGAKRPGLGLFLLERQTKLENGFLEIVPHSIECGDVFP